MKLKWIFLILFIFINTSVYAKKNKKSHNDKISKKLAKTSGAKDLKFVKVKILVYEGETLADILRRFVREDSIIFRDEKMVDMTLKNNPQVKDWRNLKTGEMLYVYLDPKFIDDNKIEQFRKKVKKVTKKIAKKIKRKAVKNDVKKFSAFYMASIGQFNQKDSALAEIDFKQNSPLTLGVMYTYFPKRGNYTIASSAYFSYLLAASTNTDETNVVLPLEIGLNTYYQRPMMDGLFYLYGGADVEKFNTFNLKAIDSSDGINFDTNEMFFLTGGASKTFSMFNRKFLFKGSFSYSLLSSRQVGYSGDDSTSTYSGYKIMGFLLSKIHKDFFLSTLLKYHSLSGPSDVSIIRIGVGCGYLF